MAFQKKENRISKKIQGQRSRLKGVYAEIVSALFLKIKGYKIMGRRLKTPVGEIDILCQKNKTLVVVEVKYRPTFETAAYCVTRRQMERLAKTVQWIDGAKYCGMKIRFDVLFIVPYKIPRHLKNVWQQSKY